jgi:hypothetical protein
MLAGDIKIVPSEAGSLSSLYDLKNMEQMRMERKTSSPSHTNTQAQ